MQFGSLTKRYKKEMNNFKVITMKKFLLTTALILLAGVTMAQNIYYVPTETKLTSSELNAMTEPTYIAIKNLSATNHFYFVGNTGAVPYSKEQFSNDAVFIWEPVEGQAGSFRLKKLNGTYMQTSSPKDFDTVDNAAVFTTTNPTSQGSNATKFNGDGDSQNYINGNDDTNLVRFVKGSNWINVQNGNNGTPLYNTGLGGWTIHYVYAVEKTTEEPVEATATVNWTTSTSWSNVEEYTSTVLSDNKLTNTKDNYTPFVGYIENEITIGGARTATVTFQYTSGSCALNVRGVEVIDANGNIVAGDYHVGKTGTNSTGNVYTVKVAKAGTYKVRCYATFDGDNRSNATNGNITVAFEKADESSFTHEVTFAAEYSTLYLGYKVAIPAGVEAYVLSEVHSTWAWAILTQVKDVIPANTAVILKKTGTTNEYHFYYTSDDADEIESNLLKGSIADRYVAEDAYVLTLKDGEVCLGGVLLNKLNGSAFLNNSHKAYLPASTLPNPSGVSFYSILWGNEEEENTTAVEKVEIVNEKVIYDLSGRRVNEITAPGIYIVGGRKVLVK